MGMLGESAFIQGDLQYSMKIQYELLENARRRRNPLHQCWGLLGVAVNNTRVGNEAQAVPMLEEALRILEETPNRSSSIETNGQLALAYLNVGKEEKALHFANRALEMALGISPTVYSMNVGYAAVAEVFFRVWEKALQRPDGKADSVKHQVLAEKSLKLLRAFKNVFPIGGPELLYFRGWYEQLKGENQSAVRTWHKALNAAEKFHMRYDQGLIHLKLGAVSEDPAVKKEHIKTAARIFEEIGAHPKTAVAKELANLP
jgi:tetratricopeptide (TPR) repeat protein